MLYQTVAEHWPAFLERAEEHGGLPRFTPSAHDQTHLIASGRRV